MALTCGFYNSIDHDRVYDATQFSAMFDGVISDGVFATYMKAFIVKVSASDNREVIVQPGRAWFNHTWIYNDADLPMATPAPGVILDRIDALVFDINSDPEVRDNSIVWVQGEEASSNPQKPTLINTLSHHQYPLCYITRRAGVYEISASDIENCIGKAPCPFVTGLIDTIDVTALMTQFESQFNTWFDGIKDTLDGDIAGHLQNEIDDLNSDVSSIQSALSNTYSPEISGLKTRMSTVENELTANNNRIYMDYKDGKYGINTSANRGADTFIPFKSSNYSIIVHGSYGEGTFTFGAKKGDLLILSGDFSVFQLTNAEILVRDIYVQRIADGGNQTMESIVAKVSSDGTVTRTVGVQGVNARHDMIQMRQQ